MRSPVPPASYRPPTRAVPVTASRVEKLISGELDRARACFVEAVRASDELIVRVPPMGWALEFHDAPQRPSAGAEEFVPKPLAEHYIGDDADRGGRRDPRIVDLTASHSPVQPRQHAQSSADLSS